MQQRKNETIDDLHQVNSIIATAIYECSREQAEHKITPEQAKHMAKSIITALADAGLEIRLHEVQSGPPTS
jgi:nitrate/nitrite-specific signal transduction histidine kinase